MGSQDEIQRRYNKFGQDQNTWLSLHCSHILIIKDSFWGIFGLLFKILFRPTAVKHGRSSSCIWNSKVPPSLIVLWDICVELNRALPKTHLSHVIEERARRQDHTEQRFHKDLTRFTLHSFTEGIDYSLTGFNRLAVLLPRRRNQETGAQLPFVSGDEF